MSRSLRLAAAVSLIALSLAVSGGLIWANTWFVRSIPLDKEFLIPWLGARTFLQYGLDPYGDQATQRAQIVYYGRLDESGDDPLRLSVPMPVELIYFPFALVTEYPLARGLWMALGEITLAASALMCFRLTGWKPPRFVYPAVLILSVLGIYSVQMLISGSAGALVFLGIVGSLAALQNERDDLAGVLGALTIFEPGIACIFLVFLVWWTIKFRRGRVWWGFFLVIISLTALSFILLPTWLLPFLRNLVADFQYTQTVSTTRILTDWWPAIGGRIGIIFTIALGLLLIIEWRRLREGGFRNLVWNASLVLSITPLLGIPTSLDGHILLLLPLLLIFSVAAERWRSPRAEWISAGALTAIFIITWLLVPNIQALFLVPPLLLLIGLYWMRWWSIRPARTWVETIRK